MFQRYGISPITLAFFRTREETEYRVFFLDASLLHIRIAIAFGLLLTAIYGLFDSYLFEYPQPLLYALAVRYIVIVPPIIFTFLLTFSRYYIRYSQIAGSITIGMVGLGWFLLAYHAEIVVVVDNYSSIIMTLIYGFFFSGLFFRFSFPIGLLNTFLYLIVIISAKLEDTLTMSLLVSLIVVFLLLTMAAYQKELLSRRLFVTETKARRTLARQARHDTRYLEWLRSLAAFLRHEVRQPVAQVNTSIELIQLKGPHDREVEACLAKAAMGTQHIWNLIERATRATRAETFVREGKPQDIQLDMLISELVEGYQQTYSGLSIVLAGLAPARVNADPLVLREAIDNLVGNAASYSRENEPVEIALITDTDNAVVVVRNKGPLVPDDASGLFDPFSSTRSEPSSVHQGLGLYIVRLVAEAYGGKARLTNLTDQTGVEASIVLPRIRKPQPSIRRYLRPNDSREPVLI